MSLTKTYNGADGDCGATFDTDSRVAAARRPLCEASNRSDEATRLRLPNKTQWALSDLLQHAQEGREGMQQMLEWIKRERLDAKGRFDAARLERIGELSEMVAQLALHVGEIERLAADARVGIYEPRLGVDHAKQ